MQGPRCVCPDACPDDADRQGTGLDAAIFWDNRDFERNPSKGQGVRFEISRDFGWFDSDSSWTVLEGELDQYVDFGSTAWFRQRVLALDFWTAHSPSWNKSSSGAIRVAPSYDFANLHSSMQIDGGVGLRAFARGFVVRADAAVSHEPFPVQMMISQPFQF